MALPAALLPELTHHLAIYVGAGPDALLFTGPSKAHPALRRNNFRKLVGWADATTKIGAPGLHFHDLRHTGNTLAAQTGASLRDLMTRMGHDSTRAALIYQHASADADRAIAEALSAALAASRDAVKPGVKADLDGDDDGPANAPPAPAGAAGPCLTTSSWSDGTSAARREEVGDHLFERSVEAGRILEHHKVSDSRHEHHGHSVALE